MSFEVTNIASINLSLNSRGDSFEFRYVAEVYAPKTGRDCKNLKVTEEFIDQQGLDPQLKKALTVKTHEQAIKFIEEMKEDSRVSLYYDKPRRDSRLFRNPFIFRGSSPKRTKENLLEHAQRRVDEQKCLSHVCFNKIGRALGRSLTCLKELSRIQIVGVVPALGFSLVGVGQVVGGSLASAVFLIPAYAMKNKNAEIALQRSVRHIVYGTENILGGLFLATPIWH